MKATLTALLAASIAAAPALAAAPDQKTILQGAADSKIEFVRQHTNQYALVPLEKFTLENKTWVSRPFTEEELLNVSCADETTLQGTMVQYCIERAEGQRPNLITRIVSERSTKPWQKKDIYSKPILVTLYDWNADGIDEGDIIKTRYRDGTAVNYTLGFKGDVYETWDAMVCGDFKTVKSGKGGWFFSAVIGWKRGNINKKYEKLLHSESHPEEARKFAEGLADITRDKVAEYLYKPLKCK